MAPHHVTDALHLPDRFSCRNPLETHPVVGYEATCTVPTMATAKCYFGTVGTRFLNPGIEGLQEVERDRPVFLLGEIITDPETGASDLLVLTFTYTHRVGCRKPPGSV